MSQPLREPSSKQDVGQTSSATGDSAGDSALPMPVDKSGTGISERSHASAGGTSSDTRGKSTGLETMLGKVFVERGFLTVDELEACREIQRKRASDDSPAELADILVENDFLTHRQLNRMRNEVEAEKSTQQIPGYKILKKLGSGAMATVFLARQLSLDRLVAIKVLPSKFSTNEKFIERFYKEGRAAAQLNHRNIVAAYDVGQAGDHHYFVMEYVDGDTVYDRIVKKKRFDEEEAIRIVRQTAEALAHAHEKGFIHRDVKPKNIMLSSEGTVKLADLGLARAVSDKEAAEQEAGRAYGTPYYISPEQIRGEVKIDGRADIYGLGATFYHMVTGKVPFEGKNPSAVMHKHLKQALVPPDHVNSRLSPGTAQVIEMMMDKSRRQRYQSVKDLITDLEHISRGESPHFAHGGADLTGLTKLEEQAAPTEPVEPAHVTTTTRQASLLDNPMFLGVAAVAGISLVINLVLILMMTMSGGAGDVSSTRPPAGGAQVSPGVSDGDGNALTGAWISTGLQGSVFQDVRTVQLALYRSGDGSLVRQFRNGATDPTFFSWSAQGGTLVLRFNEGEARYDYTISGNTLQMERQGDGVNALVLQKQ